MTKFISLYRDKKIYIKTMIVTLAIIPLLTVSGCSAWDSYQGWVDNVGNKLPTWSGLKGKKCQKFICWGDEDLVDQNATKAVDVNRKKRYQTNTPLVEENIPPENIQVPENQIRSVGSNVPSTLPRKRLPKGIMLPPMPPPPRYGTSPQLPEYLQKDSPNKGEVGKQMKPWEENPEWKNDLPKTPYDDLVKEMGY